MQNNVTPQDRRSELRAINTVASKNDCDSKKDLVSPIINNKRRRRCRSNLQDEAYSAVSRPTTRNYTSTSNLAPRPVNIHEHSTYQTQLRLNTAKISAIPKAAPLPKKVKQTKRNSFDSLSTFEDDEFHTPYAVNSQKLRRATTSWNCSASSARKRSKNTSVHGSTQFAKTNLQGVLNAQELGQTQHHRLHRLHTIRETSTHTEANSIIIENKQIEGKKRRKRCKGSKKWVKMALPLSIRNLSSKPITVGSIERLVKPEQNTFTAVSRVASNIWSSPANHTTVQNGLRSLGVEEINVRADSFTLVTTNAIANKNEVLRFTLSIESSGLYTTTIPSPRSHSDTLQPLSGATEEYSTIYMAEDNLLAILPTPTLHKWMTPLHNSLPLSALSIPGTHNSPTCYTALPSVRCQIVSPATQLENGVRFFDIRLQPPSPTDDKNIELVLVHGVFPISLTGAKYFRELLKVIQDFLARNPGETVILSLKREGVGEHSDAQLSSLLAKHYFTQGNWFLEPRVPRLGEARGKMVLMRRYTLDTETQALNNGRGIGIDAAGWTYNTKYDAREHVVVQDFCEVLETQQIPTKIDAAREFLNRSGSSATPSTTTLSGGDDVKPLHLNFLSASNFWNIGCWPDKIATKINPAVKAHLCLKHVVEKEGDGCTGVVVCDWVGENGDWDLVKCIVGFNGKIRLQASIPNT